MRVPSLSIALLLASAMLLGAGHAAAQAVEPVLSLAKKEKQPLLDTMKDIVGIETGSRDRGDPERRRTSRWAKRR